MGLNTIELSSVFQQELDSKMVTSSTSGWMEVNQNLVKYDGGNEIKIANIVMDGLGDYDREEGFPKGGVNLKYSTHKMTMDRGRTFTLDAMDVNESNFILAAGQVLKLFQNQKVIPEVDAYRYSMIAAIAMEKGRASYSYTPDSSTVFEALTNDVAVIQDKIGTDVPLIITLSVMTANILNNNEKIAKFMNTVELKKGEVSTTLTGINGIPLVTVPSDRLKTAYRFLNGSGDEKKGGYEVGTTAKTINWIIAAQSAPIAVSKQDKMRIFEPDNNPQADAYKLDYRRYHDLWIPDNKTDGIFVNIKENE